VSAIARVMWRDRDVLDFYLLLVQLWRGRWWIIAAALGMALLARFYAAVTTELYEATVILSPISAQRISLGYSVGPTQTPTLPTAGGVAALTRLGQETSRSVTEEALAVLESREFLYRFIEDLNLTAILFAEWDAETETWKAPDGEQPTEADAFEYFTDNVMLLEQDRRTGLYVLKITWRDREAAAAWANTLVERVNEEMRQRAIARADALLGFLDAELQSATAIDSRDSLNELVETQVNERMLANISDEFAFRVVDRALAPPDGEIVWPPTLLLMVAGGMFGSMLGSMCVIVFRAFRPLRVAVPRP
jgi:uncharacterized protein involved in exopolysaccharide biosynthesis